MTSGETKPVSLLMVGTGGYGYYYLKTMLEDFAAGSVRLMGAVDPFPERSGMLGELKEREIPIYESLEDFFREGQAVDLTVIASPIHFHVPQSLVALEHGSNVLCDKPVSATVQEADQLIEARDASGRWVMIGYQWSYSTAIQDLKKDIMKGVFGRPLLLKTLCFWPRDAGYYRRNNWAGKQRDEGGRWILDSPLNNAMAHFLHNLFYLLGEEIHLSSQPEEVTAELYRAYPIQNFDSAACRVITREKVELLIYVSHTVAGERGPIFNLEFEDAVVSYGDISEEIIATDNRGRTKSYGSPEADHQFLKLFEAVEAVSTPRPAICGPEAARSQTLCINGVQESVPDIPTLPDSLLECSNDGKRIWIRGLDESFYECYQEAILPGEAGVGWASTGKTVDLSDYRAFPC